MTDTNVIKTKIKLRNDSEQNWTTANPTLAKGEASIVFTTDGKTKIKVGDGTKTWQQLDYVGGDTEQHYTTDDIDSLSATYNPGDIAIETKTFAGDKVSKTAYVWNGEDWAAMDGNYNANNVFFSEEISAMYKFGKHEGTITAPVALNAVGKSVAELFTEALTEIKEPISSCTSAPNISITGSRIEDKEIGSSISMPAVKLTFTDGKYEYGPEPTGVTVPIDKATLTNDQNPTTKTTKNITVLNNNGTISLTADNTQTHEVSSVGQKVVWTWTGSAEYSAGNTQHNSIGQNSTVAGITAGTASATAFHGYKGWRYKGWCGSLTTKTAAASITVDQIKGMSKIKTSNSETCNSNDNPGAITQDYTVPVGAATVVIVALGNRTLTQVLNTTVNADMTESFNANKSTKSIGGVNNKYPVTYTIWTFSPADAYGSTANLKIKIS